MNQGKVAFLAGQFADVIHDWTTPEQFEEIKKRNRERRDLTCATHDFVDANEAMAQAFKQAFGRDPWMAIDLEAGQCTEVELQADADMWNAAWNQAKEGWL